MSNKRKLDNKNIFLISKRPKIEIQLIKATDELKTIYLNSEETSWIKILKLNEQNGLTMKEFEELWKLKPAHKLMIRIAGKNILCPRYSQSYLKSYKFSGLNHQAEPKLPQLMEKIKETSADLNQCLANWYESDGYIGKHSDDTKQLLDDSDIFSYSFGPAVRYFMLEPKKNAIGKKLKAKLEHNVLVIMGGKCQTTHNHFVGKILDNLDGRRLNLTFRSFK